MTSVVRKLGVPSAALLVALVAYVGCEGEAPSVVAADGGGDAGGGSVRDGSGDARVADANGPGAGSPRFSDWAPWNTYSAACGMRVPKGPEQLPPPLTWEPCGEHANLAGVACRRIRHDWKPSSKWNEWLRLGASASVLPSGRVVLFGAAFYPDGALSYVAEVDGDWRTALYVPGDGCVVLSDQGSPTHYAMTVYDSDPLPQGAFRGILGGANGAPVPTLVARTDVPGVMLGASLGVLEGDGAAAHVTLHPWDGSASRVLFSGGSVSAFGAFEDLIYFNVSVGGARSIQQYSPAGGLRELVGFPADPLRGAADAATDGKTWVWLDGLDRGEPGARFDDVAWMAAPFVRDPSQLAPRVLRRGLSGYGFGGSRMTIGCGRAARKGTILFPDGTSASGIHIVSLTSEEGWFIQNSSADGLSTPNPLALTCDELFLEGNELVPSLGRWVNNLFRVRLDSLSRLVWPKVRDE